MRIVIRCGCGFRCPSGFGELRTVSAEIRSAQFVSCVCRRSVCSWAHAHAVWLHGSSHDKLPNGALREAPEWLNVPKRDAAQANAHSRAWRYLQHGDDLHDSASDEQADVGEI